VGKYNWRDTFLFSATIEHYITVFSHCSGGGTQQQCGSGHTP